MSVRIIRDLLAQVKAAGTWRNPPHLAIKSTSEGEGVCNQRNLDLGGTCAPSCETWQAAIKNAEAYLAEQEATMPVQIGLLEASA